MGSGIRAEIRIDPDGQCAVAEAALAAGTACHSIDRCVDPTSPTEHVVEFTLGGDADAFVDDLDVETDAVFDYGELTTFRYRQELDGGCPCTVVESFGCPIVDQYTRGGAVFLAFHSPDIEALQALIGQLRDRFPGLDVRRLLRSGGEADDHDLVYVDRSVLTDRQREALELAHEMGYFERPKGANASEVADRMGVNRSTFSGHLAAAQSKLLDAVLDA